MGYLGRRIGLSQDKAGPSSPAGADGAVGGGILDLFASGYFQRQGNIYNAPSEPPSGLTATGGVISDYTDGPAVYRAHIFTSSGTFDVTAPGDFGDTVEYLVVAGGGSGGGAPTAGGGRGGGGAGGLRTNLPGVQDAGGNPLTGSAFPVSTSPGSYTVTIGAGAARGNNTSGNKGVDSYFGPPSTPDGITASGGGAGGYAPEFSPSTENDGGSGGGTYNSGAPNIGLGNTPPTSPPQGNNSGQGSDNTASGGGGAGAVGSSAPSTVGGAGGAGVQVAIAGPAADTTGVGALNPGPGQYQWFAGGGGGAGSWNASPGAAGAGGVGGGGDGKGDGDNADGDDGLEATGGGGGGTTGQNPGAYNGGNGGSGIVIVRYKIGSVATAKATGGAISFYGDKTIHTFTSSGTFVNPASIDNVEVVMVAGGGSGGLNIGGGGGAGAVLESPSSGFTFPNNTYTITIGAGAAGRSSFGPATPNTANDTTISYPGPYTWTAQRGGYGSTYPNVSVQPGGSGGGAGPDPASQSGGTSTAADSPTPIGTLTAYGNAGGDAGGYNYQGGGGGGAGGAGETITTPGVGGDGGVGRQLPTTFQNPAAAPSDSTNPQPYQRGGGLGTPGPAGSYYVAGGGGGSGYSANNPDHRGLGGSGGGGDGGYYTQSPPATDGQNAVANTGSGGGGSGYSPTSKSTAGSGGSGIVLIAYPT